MFNLFPLIIYWIPLSENLVAADRDFDGPEYAYLSREDRYSEGVRKSMLEWSKRKKYNLTDAEDINYFVS